MMCNGVSERSHDIEQTHEIHEVLLLQFWHTGIEGLSDNIIKDSSTLRHFSDSSLQKFIIIVIIIVP